MKIFNFILKQIKTKPDIWLFFCFLLTFCFSVRKVILYFPIQRTFNEYTGTYLYLSDILLIATIGSWLLLLFYNNIDYLSNKFFYIIKKVTNQEKKAYISQKLPMHKLGIDFFIHNLYLFLPLFLIFLAGLSVAWSSNQIIASYRSLKLLELYLLYLFLIFRFVPMLVPGKSDVPSVSSADKRGTIRINLQCSTWNIAGWIIIFLGFFQSVIAIIQVFLQHSVGIKFLKESIINQNIPGVAKIVLNGEKYIRAYGTFSHPNILGGFLLLSIILSFLYFKLFYSGCESNLLLHPKKHPIVPRGTIGCSGTSVEQWKLNKNFFSFLILIQIITLILTFSKSAILGLIIALIYIFYKTYIFYLKSNLNKKHQIILFFNYIKKRRYFRICLLSILILISFFFVFLKPDLNLLFVQSLQERLEYLNVPRGTFISNQILGLGLGQFVINMQDYFKQSLLSWQFQPVHNVFLLVFSELGLIGLILFVYWLWDIFYNKSIKNKERGEYILYNNNIYMSIEIILIYLKGVLLGFIFIMLFDHYFWDIWLGQVMLWLILGLIVGIQKNANRIR